MKGKRDTINGLQREANKLKRQNAELDGERQVLRDALFLVQRSNWRFVVDLVDRFGIKIAEVFARERDGDRDSGSISPPMLDLVRAVDAARAGILEVAPL